MIGTSVMKELIAVNVRPRFHPNNQTVFTFSGSPVTRIIPGKTISKVFKEYSREIHPHKILIWVAKLYIVQVIDKTFIRVGKDGEESPSPVLNRVNNLTKWMKRYLKWKLNYNLLLADIFCKSSGPKRKFLRWKNTEVLIVKTNIFLYVLYMRYFAQFGTICTI